MSPGPAVAEQGARPGVRRTPQKCAGQGVGTLGSCPRQWARVELGAPGSRSTLPLTACVNPQLEGRALIPCVTPPVPAQGWWLLRKPRPGEDQRGGSCLGTQEGGSHKDAPGKGEGLSRPPLCVPGLRGAPGVLRGTGALRREGRTTLMLC